MKKLIALVVCVLMVVCVFAACATTEAPVEEEVAVEEEVVEEEVVEEEVAEEVLALEIGFYADGADSYYQLAYEAMQGCADLDAACDWTIDYKVGQNTAPEQVQAVQDFITAGYDAIVVIQNSVDATSECIAMCKDAGIPYFGAGHEFSAADNALDAAGASNYDFQGIGYDTGVQAYADGVTKIVNIEGQLGQGSAGAQTLGLLEGMEAEGANLGGFTALEIAEQKPAHDAYNGEQTVEIVFWASGGWFEDPAYEATADAITTLGADGFDAIYAHNNPMMDGCINAVKDAGLNPADYWFASCNGRESSWEQAQEGIVKFDANQPGSMEGVAMYQMVKAYFKGEEYPQFVHPVASYYTDETINDVIDTLIPCYNVDGLLEMIEAGELDIALDGPMFMVNPNYAA